MFTDPQSVTVATVAKSLPKIDVVGRKSVYRSADGQFTLTVSHDEKNRCRRLLKLTQEIVAADPFLTDVNRTYIQHAQLTLDHPRVGFTSVQIDDLAQALVDYAADAVIDKIIAGES